MNKKSKKTLKDAFNIPEPNRKEQFFNSLEIRQPKKLPAHIPMYVSAVATAVLVIGVWGGVKNLPYFDPPEITDTPVYSRTASATDVFTENSNIQTTVVSVTGKSTDGTSVTGTATENITGNSETVTTVTETEDNNPAGLHTTDGLSGSTAENRHTTNEKTTTAQTTRRTATKTNTTTTHTVTTVTGQSQYVTTKSTANQTHTTVSQTTINDEVNVIDTVPQTTATYDYGFDPPPCTEPSNDDPPDYTVKPPVRYYPDDISIDINDCLSNDVTVPTHPSSGAQTDANKCSWKDLAENSDLIVIATVEEIIYTGIDGRPYTQEDIKISEVIKGDIPEKSKISVYGRGGYIPAVDYGEILADWITENNYMLFDPAGNMTATETGGKYIYFIRKSSSPFPDGSYILTGLNNISKFIYTDGSYMNLNDSRITFTLNELYSYLN